MPGTSRSVRKSWAGRHQRADEHVGRQVSGAESNISDVESFSIDGQSIDELIEFIVSSQRSNIDLSYFQQAIKLATRADGVMRQTDVITACMCRLLCGNEPKEQQVRSLRRLVFGVGDTLLLAKTGFGKSIIFHAYSMLTGKITIQLVPLSKLGEEQVGEINKYPVTGTNACLVSHDTKKKNTSLVKEIWQGKYTHIVTSPEQIAMDWFLELVRDVDFRDRIGLVAIDECHLVSTWATFREAYAKVFTLRANLLPSVSWFGCTATMTREQEVDVLQFGGFRSEGFNPGELEIIRTSIDRPDISIHFLPIPPKKHASLQCLYPLLDEAVHDVTHTVLPVSGGEVSHTDRVALSSTEDSDTDPSDTAESTTEKELTPQNIPKTILFIDGKTKVASVAQALIDELVLIGYSVSQASSMVEEFHSFTPSHNKDRVLDEFRKADSDIRILVATTAVGLGMNLPDIERVVVYGLLITMDLSDLMQRIGRAARAAGRTGDAIIFLPYWLFSDYGEDKPGQTPLPVGKGKTKGKRRGKKRSRNKPVPGKATGASQTQSAGQDSDTETVVISDGEESGFVSDPGHMDGRDEETSPTKSTGRWCTKRKYWTKEERERRAGVDSIWFEIINAQCHRQALMEYFQEGRADEHTKENPPPAGRCCNGSGCEKKMSSYDSWPLRKLSPTASDTRKPNAGTLAAFALDRINQWCAEYAIRLGGPRCRVKLPAWTVLSSSLQIKVANLFRPPQGRRKSGQSCPINSVDDLRKVVSLTDWGPSAKYEQEFIDFLIQEFPKIQEEHAAARARSNAEKNAEKNTEQDDAVQATGVDNLTKLGAELMRNPNDRRLRERVDNEQSMLVAMFRRRHEPLTTRLSSAVPSAQVQSSIPYIQSPLRTNVSIDSSGGQVDQDATLDPVAGMYGYN
jgi:superfamily II DNA/RNA helicase